MIETFFSVIGYEIFKEFVVIVGFSNKNSKKDVTAKIIQVVSAIY